MSFGTSRTRTRAHSRREVEKTGACRCRARCGSLQTTAWIRGPTGNSCDHDVSLRPCDHDKEVPGTTPLRQRCRARAGSYEPSRATGPGGMSAAAPTIQPPLAKRHHADRRATRIAVLDESGAHSECRQPGTGAKAGVPRARLDRRRLNVSRRVRIRLAPTVGAQYTGPRCASLPAVHCGSFGRNTPTPSNRCALGTTMCGRLIGVRRRT